MDFNKISRYINYKLIAWIIAFEVIGVLIGLSTKPGIDPWYTNLNKSSLTPPGYIFSIVWPLLYLSLAIFGYIIYNTNNVITRSRITNLYWIQMLLNWSWSYIFFNLKMTFTALLILIAILGINAFVIIYLIRSMNRSCYILLPYFVWICFAGYLNVIIVVLNN